MKNRIIPVIIILLGLFIAGCHTSSNPPVQNLFRLNFQEGKSYEYQMSWDMDHTIMGRLNKLNFSSLYAVTVAEIDGHDRILTGTYRNFKMHMRMMGIEFDIDTEKPLPALDTTDQIGFVKRVFHGIVGKTFKMKVDQQGEIIWVKGFDEIVESMIDSLGLDAQTKAVAFATLKDQFSNEMVRDQFVQVFAIFPNKTISIGDTWDKSHELLGGKIPAKFTNTYVVKAIDDDLVTLDVKSRIDSKLDMGITGEQTGTIVADSRWGLVVDADFQQNMEVKSNEMTMQMKGVGKIRGKEIER